MARWPPLPDKRRAARWGFRSRVFIYKFFLFFWFAPLSHLIKKNCVLDDFIDRHTADPNLSLVNKESLDNILRAEIFIHNDSQL